MKCRHLNTNIAQDTGNAFDHLARFINLIEIARSTTHQLAVTTAHTDLHFTLLFVRASKNTAAYSIGIGQPPKPIACTGLFFFSSFCLIEEWQLSQSDCKPPVQNLLTSPRCGSI